MTVNTGVRLAEPGVVTVHDDGTLVGRTSQYEKCLADMAGVYRDAAAYQAEVAVRGGDTVVYRVEESRAGTGPGSLMVGTSTLLPGRIGAEYAMTRGHLHAQASRAEMYYCVSGHGVMLLDGLDGRSRVLEMTPGVAVNVPGYWVHRSVNVGAGPLVTLFVYDQDAGQDYDIISDAGGMSQLIVISDGGWKAVPNPDHRPYQR